MAAMQRNTYFVIFDVLYLINRILYIFRNHYIDTTRQEFIPTLAIKEQTMASPLAIITSEHPHAPRPTAHMSMNRGKHCPELMNA
jgi:hypothetical protein